MVPPDVRMRSGVDFSTTSRRGRRTARPSLVLHSDLVSAPGVKVGFVVSKAVGNAVQRNRVKRRLRHLVAARLPEAPAGLRLVIRALPAAAGSAELGSDLDAAWSSAERRGWSRQPSTTTQATATT